MEKQIALSLNNFAEIPSSLQLPDNLAKLEISVNLANLYHHYYLDSYGIAPPNPDPAHFEYLQFLSSEQSFRFSGSGVGVNPGAKRSRSTELGQAFCRLFLHNHLGIAHFAHLHDVLDRGLGTSPPVKVTRVAQGDSPDYLCSTASGNVYLAEAKGRYSQVDFYSPTFQKWRDQFGRVIVTNSAGQAMKVKGYIVETAYGTESRPNFRSRILAEDPETRGNEPLNALGSVFLAGRTVSMHYGHIARKMGFELVSAALLGGFSLPDILRFAATVWSVLVPGLHGENFVGGYFHNEGNEIRWEQREGKVILSRHPYLLNYPRGTFFGIRESTFKEMVGVARGQEGLQRAEPLEPINGLQLDSALSLLRDGSILGPAEYFSPLGIVQF